MKPRMAYVGNRRKKKEKDKKDVNEAQDPRKELLQVAGFHMNQIINGRVACTLERIILQEKKRDVQYVKSV